MPVNDRPSKFRTPTPATAVVPPLPPVAPPNAAGLRENTGLHRGFNIVPQVQPQPAGPMAIEGPARATPKPPPNAGGVRENTGAGRGFEIQPSAPAGAPRSLPAPASPLALPAPAPAPVVEPPAPTPPPNAAGVRENVGTHRGFEFPDPYPITGTRAIEGPPRSAPKAPPNAAGVRENTGAGRGFDVIPEPRTSPLALPAPVEPAGVKSARAFHEYATGPAPVNPASSTQAFADYATTPYTPPPQPTAPPIPAAAEAIPAVEPPAASLVSRALNSEFTLGGAIKGAATAPFRGVKGGYGLAKAALATPISAAGAGRAALGAAKGVGPMLALGAAADPEGTLHMLAHPLAAAQAIPGAIGGELAGIANEPGFAAGASRVGSDLYAATLGPIVGAGWNLGHGARTWFDNPSRIGGDLAYAGNRIGEEFGAIDPVTERGKADAQRASDQKFLADNGYVTPSPEQERRILAEPPAQPATPEGSVPNGADVLASIGTGRQATPGQAAADAPPPPPTPATAEGPAATRGFESATPPPVGADGQPAGPGWTPRIPRNDLRWQPQASPGSAESFHSGRIPDLASQYQAADARVQAAESAARGPDGQLVWSASEPPGGDPKLNAIREAFSARDGVMDQLNAARSLASGFDPEEQAAREARSMPATREMRGGQVAYNLGYQAPAQPGGQGQIVRPFTGTDTVKPQANPERDARIGLLGAQAEESRAKADLDRSNLGQAGMKERILKNPADALTAAIVSGQDPEVASAGLARVEAMKRGMQEGPITDANAADRLRYLMPPAQAIFDDPKLANRNPGSVIGDAMQRGLFADGIVNDPAEQAFGRQAVARFGIPALRAEADANLNGWFNGGDVENRRRSRDILRQLLEQYGLGAPAVAGPPAR